MNAKRETCRSGAACAAVSRPEVRGNSAFPRTNGDFSQLSLMTSANRTELYRRIIQQMAIARKGRIRKAETWDRSSATDGCRQSALRLRCHWCLNDFPATLRAGKTEISVRVIPVSNRRLDPGEGVCCVAEGQGLVLQIGGG